MYFYIRRRIMITLTAILNKKQRLPLVLYSRQSGELIHSFSSLFGSGPFCTKGKHQQIGKSQLLLAAILRRTKCFPEKLIQERYTGTYRAPFYGERNSFHYEKWMRGGNVMQLTEKINLRRWEVINWSWKHSLTLCLF